MSGAVVNNSSIDPATMLSGQALPPVFQTLDEVSFAMETVDAEILARIARKAPMPLVADFGCGDLRFAGKLLDHIPSATLVGVDKDLSYANPEMAGRAVILMEHDISAPSNLPANKFTHAVLAWVAQDLSPRGFATCLEEINRILAQDGELFVCAPHIDLESVIHRFQKYYIDHGDGLSMELAPNDSYWARPINTFESAFSRAGFRIADLKHIPVPPPEAVKGYRFNVTPGMNHSMLFVLNKTLA